MQPKALVPVFLASTTSRSPRLPHVRLEAQPRDSIIARRAVRSSAINTVIAAAALVSVLALKEQPAAQGWVGAAGAALVFGGSSLPAKHPAAVAAGPLGFQLWVTVGNSTLNLLLLFLLRIPIVWSGYGVVGALFLTLTQLCAWPAIQRLGAAAGPGIWCGVGMVTSFLWGTAYFGEALTSPALATGGLLLLALGVAGVAASHAVANSGSSPLTAAADAAGSSTTAELPVAMTEARGGATSGAASGVAIGVAFALATGLFDGSLMAPFSAYAAAAAQSGSASEQLALLYLGGFALALPIVALLPILLVLGARSLAAVSKGAQQQPLRPRFLSCECAMAGLSVGGLWASANVLSVHATMRLGQAVGFPLTQVCVVISALWGIIYFGELRDRRALTIFGASSAVVLAGAAVLKAAR